jgi:hypothetical protein
MMPGAPPAMLELPAKAAVSVQRTHAQETDHMATRRFGNRLARLAMVGAVALALGGGLVGGARPAGATCIAGVDCDPVVIADPCVNAKNKLAVLQSLGATAQQIRDAKYVVFVNCDL